MGEGGTNDVYVDYHSGTGFVCAYVLKQISAQGQAVVAYDQMPNMGMLEAVLGQDAGRVQVVRGDVLDLPLMVRTAREHHVDRIVHLAYLLGGMTERNPALATRVNVEGANNVFEMAGFLGLRRVVWASSIAVFGPRSAGAQGVVGPDVPFDPQTVYGASKLTNELTARRYAYIYGLEPMGLRFPVLYGPEVIRGWAAFLSSLAAGLVRGEERLSAPRDDHKVNWGYVEDIADAVVRALRVPRPPQRVYTVAGYEATVGDAVAAVLEHFPGAEVAPMEKYPMVRLESRFDVSPAKADLGWQPQVSIDEGARWMVDHYRSRLA